MCPGDAPPRPSERILLVEDNALLGSLVRRILESKGFQVLLKATGREALESSRPEGGRVGLLITDLGMPDMSGAKLAEILRAQDPSLRVLYMSGHPEDTLVHRGSLPEGADFLQKPFTPEVLTAKVQEILARPPS
jgi:two-component system cell cycle sensor histidine kinase/response regulator CckA